MLGLPPFVLFSFVTFTLLPSDRILSMDLLCVCRGSILRPTQLCRWSQVRVDAMALFYLRIHLRRTSARSRLTYVETPRRLSWRFFKQLPTIGLLGFALSVSVLRPAHA